MSRKGTYQTGVFNVRPGMVFTMPDMEILHSKPDIDADTHPWLVLQVFDDYIETVMCSTLECKTEDKHRTNDLKYDNVTDLTNPCPPMDRPEVRTGKVSLDTAIFLPKKELFSHKIKIWNENTPTRNFTTEGLKSLCMNKKEIDFIREEIRTYQKEYKETWYDPFHCEDSEEYIGNLELNLPVPDGFTKETYDKRFGWQHLPKANTYAVYPFEDQMYDYEKQDPELIKIARKKKELIDKRNNSVHNNKKSSNKKRGQQAENKFGHISTNNPNTGLGLGE